MTETLALRPVGTSGVAVRPIAMGCWPISGMTSLGVGEAESLRTLRAAFDHGVNCFDTAYCYGADGESDRLIAKALGDVRDKIVIAGKVGIAWGSDGQMVIDGRPEVLRKQCETSLQRLQVDRMDLLYLHAPDSKTPIKASACELRRLLEEGKTRAVGVSNVNRSQLEEFASECPLSAFQPPYNMLQRQIEAAEAPWCVGHGVAIMAYWPLLKGLLAGKLARAHQFDARDGRKKYPMFQGLEWERNQDFLDTLRGLAREAEVPLVTMVLAWTIRQPGITAALCGAKRSEQIIESAAALTWRPTDDLMAAIDRAIAARGEPITRPAVIT